MTSRIHGLEDIDPLSVPLPHGTEVTLRVERLVGGRRIPQGLIGRIMRARDGGFDVTIAGVGEVWYARAELSPRKAGQLEFALRREQAWSQLRPCVVLSATVGSRAWGLANEESDVDVRGAFALPFGWSLGLVEPPADLVSADGSTTFWETRKLVHQALRADPNTLELLFVKSVQAHDELGEWILAARQAFVSKLMFGSFGRYALSQLDKLASAQRLSLHRDQVLDWLTESPTPSLDVVAARLAALSDRQAASPGDAAHQAKLYLKQLYRSLSDQGLIEANDFDAMVRYAQQGGRRPADARQLRPKNAYNLLRLIHAATVWLRDGQAALETTGAVRERLLQIKNGNVALDDVLAEAEALTPAMELARDESRLPERPDYAAADALLKRIGAELARRHVTGAPGPLGTAAPAPPSPVETTDDA